MNCRSPCVYPPPCSLRAATRRGRPPPMAPFIRCLPCVWSNPPTCPLLFLTLPPPADQQKPISPFPLPGLPHTIVRPGPLEDGPATGTAVVTESPTGYGGIVRADLADLLVGAAASPLATGKTFTAVDRTKYVNGRAAPRGSAGGEEGTRRHRRCSRRATSPRRTRRVGWSACRSCALGGQESGGCEGGEVWLLRVGWRAQLRLCLAVWHGFGETVGVGGSAPAAHPSLHPQPPGDSRALAFRPCLIVPMQPTHRLVPLPLFCCVCHAAAASTPRLFHLPLAPPSLPINHVVLPPQGIADKPVRPAARVLGGAPLHTLFPQRLTRRPAATLPPDLLVAQT